MKKLLAFIPVAALVVIAFAGCGTDVETDIEHITSLLLTSYFTGDGADGVTDDNTSAPSDEAGLAFAFPGDSGHQGWVRKVEYAQRVVDVDVSDDGDSAFAIVSRHLTGRIYIDTLRGNGILDTISRPINDTMYREVVLSKDDGKLFGGWKIESVTPAEIWTIDPATPVKIEKISVTSSSGVDFEITDSSDFYDRDDIPWFTTEDTVTVEVWLETDVQAWAYLHHGRHFRLKYNHHRKVFDRDTEDPLYFTGTWVTADDSLFNKPATVRHAAIDILLEETLGNDFEAEYSAYAIAIPYVVAKPGEVLPDDGDEVNE